VVSARSRFAVQAAVSALAFVVVAVARSAETPERDPLPVPDLPGFRTLKADFHLHTVFSDGEVWPTVPVWEAWRDGLDVISLTDHVEYRPHASDVSLDLQRAYEVARPVADQLGIVLVAGVEITRPVPGAAATIPVGSAHFNALFVTDPKALDVPRLLDALRAARAQGAFVFWNHPGFMGTLEPFWHAHVDEAYREGLFGGMELVNGKDFYPTAYPWTVEKDLTILCNSDAHRPIPARSVGGPRAITLVFARTMDADGVREALLTRRTAAWLGDDVWGAEDHLRGLWRGAVELKPHVLSAKRGERLIVQARNSSAIPFRLRPRSGPSWLRLEAATLAERATGLIHLSIANDAATGTHQAVLEVEVSNLHVGPGRELLVTIPVEVTVR